jgi:hypothetical protein
MHEFFQAAIDDRNRAVEAVRIAANVVNGTPVESSVNSVQQRSVGCRLSLERSGRCAEPSPDRRASERADDPARDAGQDEFDSPGNIV